MRTMRFVVLFFALALVAVPDNLHAQKKQRGDRNLITQDDLAEARGGMNTAYDAVRMLRSQWLNPPLGRNSSATVTGGESGVGGGAKDVIVYVDDMRQQTTEDLKTVKVATIVEIRYLDQNRAIQLHGPGHELGVIEVTTVNKKK